MVDDGPVERARQNATGIVAAVVTGVWLTAAVLDFEWAVPFMFFGYIVLVPLTSILFGEDEEDSSERQAGAGGRERSTGATAGADTALETLRERYARGELTEEQFERKVERLLETDTLENAAERRRDRERSRDRDRVSETE